MAERCGLSESMIENIESGRPGDDGSRRREVTIDELMAIARGMGLSMKRLLPDEAMESDRIDLNRAAREQQRRENEIAELMRKIEQAEVRLEQLQKQLHMTERDIAVMRNGIKAWRNEINRLQAGKDLAFAVE